MPQTGGPSSAWTYHQNTRWWSYFNSEPRLTVPPYGCMAIRSRFLGNRKLTHIAQFQAEGDVVWNIGQPNDEEASIGDSSMFMFNGPYATPPLTVGRFGTFDFPAQVLHNGAGDTLPNGYPCGPVPRTWFVMRNQLGQFKCLSHDITHAAHLGGGGAVHTVWVTRGNGDGGLHGYWTGGGPSIHNGADVPMVQGAFELGGATGVFMKDGWMTVAAAGVWHFGFQCTIRGAIEGPSESPRGSILRLGLVKRDLQQKVTTLPWTGQRKQDIENGIPKNTEPPDSPGEEVTWGELLSVVNDKMLVTEENVAFTGFVNLRAGEGLRIRNIGATADVLFAQFWATRTIQYFDINPAPEAGGFI